MWCEGSEQIASFSVSCNFTAWMDKMCRYRLTSVVFQSVVKNDKLQGNLLHWGSIMLNFEPCCNMIKEIPSVLHSPTPNNYPPLRTRETLRIYSSGIPAEINYITYCSMPQKFTVHEKLNMHGLHLYRLIKL